MRIEFPLKLFVRVIPLAWPSLRIVTDTPPEPRPQAVFIDIGSRKPAPTDSSIELSPGMDDPTILENDTLAGLQLQFEGAFLVLEELRENFEGLSELLELVVVSPDLSRMYRALERRGIVDMPNRWEFCRVSHGCGLDYRPAVVIYGALMVVFVAKLNVGKNIKQLRSHLVDLLGRVETV